MNFKLIDMNRWERAECYKHFSTIAKSTYSITVDVDITELFHYTREKSLRLFPSFTWVVTTAINKQEEFRMGFDEEGNLGIWDEVYPDYSVMDEKTKIMNSLCTPYDKSFAVFYKQMCKDTDEYKYGKKETSRYPNFFVASCIPWITYSSFTATNESEYTFLFPMVTWGKYYEVNGRVKLPLTLQIHHAVADGYHCSLFFEAVEQIVSNPGQYLYMEQSFC